MVPAFHDMDACPKSPPSAVKGGAPAGSIRGRSREAPEIAPLEVNPSVAIFSGDERLIGLIREGLTQDWVVDRCANPDAARLLLVKSGLKIIVVDDASIDPASCGWLLDQIRKWAPHALVAYIAAHHDSEVEKRARSRNVQGYFSRPLDRDRILRILSSFANAHR
jgi:hypothetical protein